jgi:hypothetical protein
VLVGLIVYTENFREKLLLGIFNNNEDKFEKVVQNYITKGFVIYFQPNMRCFFLLDRLAPARSSSELLSMRPFA